jgi:hypothetical protein
MPATIAGHPLRSREQELKKADLLPPRTAYGSGMRKPGQNIDGRAWRSCLRVSGQIGGSNIAASDGRSARTSSMRSVIERETGYGRPPSNFVDCGGLDVGCPVSWPSRSASNHCVVSIVGAASRCRMARSRMMRQMMAPSSRSTEALSKDSYRRDPATRSGGSSRTISAATIVSRSGAIVLEVITSSKWVGEWLHRGGVPSSWRAAKYQFSCHVVHEPDESNICDFVSIKAALHADSDKKDQSSDR